MSIAIPLHALIRHTWLMRGTVLDVDTTTGTVMDPAMATDMADTIMVAGRAAGV